MRIAIHSPSFVFHDPARDFTGYNRAFFTAAGATLYFPSWKRAVFGGPGFESLLCERLGVEDIDVVFSLRELNRRADILVSFNDFPYKRELRPPRGFHGMKVWHLMDYVFRPTEVNRRLEAAGVDYVMGYTDHAKYCPFWRKSFPRFVGRVIPVPFGFGDRFRRKTAFAERKDKVIAAGSVNPIYEPKYVREEDLAEYIQFYHDRRWTHEWRRMLKENEAELSDIMDSVLPDYPESKNLAYDAVGLMNEYQFFANDEGLMAFPPARTYEGMACGAVLVGARHPCYDDLGLKDGENCVLHEKHDLADFRERVEYYRKNPSELEVIAEAGYCHAQEHFSHAAVARRLHERISELYSAADGSSQ